MIPNKKTINKKTIKELVKAAVNAVTSGISETVVIADPNLAVPAAVVSAILQSIFSIMIDSAKDHPDIKAYIDECCECANISSNEQEKYISKALFVCKSDDFSQISSTCLENLSDFYQNLKSIVNSDKQDIGGLKTTKLVDLLFYSTAMLEISKLDEDERDNYITKKLLILLRPTEKEAEVKLISKESRRPKDSFDYKSRANEIKKLTNEINENDKIGLISGIGGIGKTEICKYIFHKCRSKNAIKGIKYVGWITYTNSLVETLFSQVKCDKNHDSIYNGYEDSLAYLNSLGNELLLFVDNLDNSVAVDSEISRLFNLNCKLVITTRIQYFDGIKPIVIDSLNEQWATKVFKYFCPQKCSSSDLHRIYRITQGHPLTVELLAKTINYSQDSASVIIDSIEKSGFSLEGISEAIPFDQYNKMLIEHLKRFFSLQKLQGKYRQILYRLSLFSYAGISSKQISTYKVGKYADVEYLANRGWIELSDGSVSMHPVISDAILSASSNTYAHYKAMYEAMRDILEIPSDVRPETKYNDMLICEHVIKRKNFQKEEYAAVCIQIGVVYNRMGEKERAIRLLVKGAKVKENLNLPEESLFTVYNNIGIACNLTDHAEMNVSYLEKAKAIGEKLYNQNPLEYAEKYATTLNNLSLAYVNREELNISAHDRLMIAKDNQSDCIDILKQFFGDNYVLLARSYNNMAIVFNRLGDKESEYEYQKKALSIENSPERPIFLFNFARMELERGNKPGAISSLKQAISIWETSPEFYYNRLIKAYTKYVDLLDENSDEKQKANRRLKELKDQHPSILQ